MKFHVRLAGAAAAAMLALAVPAFAQSVPAMNTSVAKGEDAVATYFTEDSVGDVQLGRLGLERSRNAAVRQVAQALVRDHTMTARAGMRVAKAIGDTDVQFKPGDDNQLELSRLAQYSGAQFDREYIKTLIDAHKIDINTAGDALDFVKSSQLRSYLQTTLAVDRKHLQMAQAAQTKL